jgi:hypothetical protein
MSSQGGAAATAPSYPGFTAGPTSGTTVALGYSFDTDSIRDASDWIAYKKQRLVRTETKAIVNQDSWFKSGNDYRIQFILGRIKCGSCPAGAFNQGAPT